MNQLGLLHLAFGKQVRRSRVGRQGIHVRRL